MAARFELDHAGITVRSLDDAETRYRRLGFTLTDRSFHVAPRREDGKLVPAGTGNHCIMLRRGYVELIAVTDPYYDGHLLGDLKSYEGLHLLALGTPSAEQARADLQQAVGHLGAIGEVRDLARPISERGVAATAKFRLVDVPQGLFPEGFFFAIQHMTRAVLWQPHLLDHANGAETLLGAVACVGDPGGFLDRLAMTFGGERAGNRLRLAAGEIEALDPDALGRRFPGVAPPSMPFLAGIKLAVADLETARRQLAREGVAAHADPGRLWVAPDQACGAVLEFVAVGA